MTSEPLDLKQTLNLPRTDFSMKANLPQAEPKMLARWAEQDLYAQIRASRAGKPTYILHDGPPYANGRIHLGTAFNKIIKDFIVKSRTMAGYDAPYVPGWDCHGLPIEHKVDQELGPKKAAMSTASIRRACRKYAEKFVNIQREDFKRLGVLGSWDKPYLTMSPEYQAVIAGAFVDFLEKGYVYKGLKPVGWCLHDRTALAEAEVEYADHKSPSVWVRFRLTSDSTAIDSALAGKQVYGLIWTTTPWTLPANLGISFNAKYQYVAAEVGEAVYIVAEDLLEVTAKKCGWESYSILAKFTGAKLDRTTYQHPFINRESLGMLGDHVTLEQGTGAVHTAPGHGQEDYVVSMQYGLEVYCPVDASGKFFDPPQSSEGGVRQAVPPVLLGKTVWEGNPLVIELLKQSEALLATEVIEHSYPHCWRCHNPTIYRATEQWFIGMDQKGLRQNALNAIKQVTWNPTWGEDRISNMVSSRPDWCISRQRVWGVPIVIFYCEKCREPLTDTKILRSVIDLFKTHSADIWFEKTAAELIPAGTACTKCGSPEFTKENDILDVWFDSGSSHLAVLNETFGLTWPADLYMEGGDQYRGWFQSSLLIGTGLKGSAPYRAAATHGWTLDGEGRAMHKSLGNDIPPESIIKDYGADILRLWCASVEFTEDVRLTPVMLTRLAEAYRKLRNTFRYILGNIHDLKEPVTDLLPIDQWVLHRAADLNTKCLTAYQDLAFHKVYRSVYDFATVDLSSIYFDVLKDRLYTSAKHSHARRSAQTALLSLAQTLVRLLAPILSFTTEEIWPHVGGQGSIHTEYFQNASAAQSTSDDYDKLIETRDTVLKALDNARQEKFIGAPLEAKVILTAAKDQFELLTKYKAELPGLYIVSAVEVIEGESLSATIQRAEGAKCERCWKYSQDTGAICHHCAEAVNEFVLSRGRKGAGIE